MPVTQRDQIWQAAIELREAVEDDERRESLGLTNRYGMPGFTPEDVHERAGDDVSIRTVRDCLNAMTTLGVLAKRTSRPTRYRAPKDASERGGRAGAETASTTDDVDDVQGDAGAVDGEPVDEDSGISVAVDVEEEAADESDESAPQRATTAESIEWSALDLPGSGATLEQRQDAVRELYEFLQQEGDSTASEMRELVWARTGYASAKSAWKNCLADGLKQVAEQDDSLHVPSEGAHRWRYIDAVDVEE